MESASAEPERRAVATAAIVVFVVAVLLRLPSCYESFWLDELHTAWSIWDDFGDVAPRAEVGNQTPLYFQLTWLWKQILGPTEVALRLSSVLAVSFAAALLVIGVSKTAQRLSAGILSGMVLAVESNAIFFGTELRAYSWLMLIAVIALWSGMELLNGPNAVKPSRLRLLFVASACLASLLHPTAMVTFGVLAAAVFGLQLVQWIRRSDRRAAFNVLDLICLLILVATAFLLANSTVPDSWQRREYWKAFGQATTVRQLWTIWPWATMVGVPLALGMLTAWKRSWREMAGPLLPLLVAVLTTVIFFFASYADYVPLWHRRYFIAVLPLLTWFAGCWTCFALPSKPTPASRLTATLLVAIVLISLTWHQGTAQRLVHGKTRLAIRGEAWREAIAWVNKQQHPNDSVWLDSGLIEVRIFAQSYNVDLEPDQLQWQYFTFPTLGPYKLPKAQVASPSARWGAKGDRGPRDFPSDRQGRQSLWIISRSRYTQVEDWCKSLSPRSTEVEIRRFGRIHVARLSRLTADESGDESETRQQ